MKILSLSLILLLYISIEVNAKCWDQDVYKLAAAEGIIPTIKVNATFINLCQAFGKCTLAAEDDNIVGTIEVKDFTAAVDLSNQIPKSMALEMSLSSITYKDTVNFLEVGQSVFTTGGSQALGDNLNPYVPKTFNYIENKKISRFNVLSILIILVVILLLF